MVVVMLQILSRGAGRFYSSRKEAKLDGLNIIEEKDGCRSTLKVRYEKSMT